MQEVKKIQEAYFGKLSSKAFGPLGPTAFDPRAWLKENLFDVYPSSNFVTVSYFFSFLAIASFSLLGYFLAKQAVSFGAFKSNKAFLTARRSQGFFRIGWSFFAITLGAWSIASPPTFAATHGYLGLLGFAIATAIPIIIMARLGERVQAQLHDPFSLVHYVRMRFGSTSQLFVSALCFLSSATALLVEYMVLGSVFHNFLKVSPLLATLLIGFFTLLYTSYGGLSVSILTDQVQGILSFLLILVMSLYTAIYFRPTFSSMPEHLGATSQGAWSLLTLPISFITYSMFSESMWQRIWAGRTNIDVRKGASFSSVLVFVVTLALGIMGYLTSWAYHIDPTAPAHSNILLFRSLGRDQYNWMGILLIVLATIMAQGSVDSQQNALNSIIASSEIFKGQSPTLARSLVTLVNIPLVLIGSFYPEEAMQVFLFINLLSTCAALPLLAGLVQRWSHVVDGSTFLLGSLSGMLALTSYGMIHTGTPWEGLTWAWCNNEYDTLAFITPLIGSLAGVIVSVVNNLGGGIIQKLGNAT